MLTQIGRLFCPLSFRAAALPSCVPFQLRPDFSPCRAASPPVIWSGARLSVISSGARRAKSRNLTIVRVKQTNNTARPSNRSLHALRLVEMTRMSFRAQRPSCQCQRSMSFVISSGARSAKSRNLTIGSDMQAINIDQS